ncbi:MAG TPA: hypothetical protein VIJ99_11160, partial [Acidimicrobiales bacterium]
RYKSKMAAKAFPSFPSDAAQAAASSFGDLTSNNVRIEVSVTRTCFEMHLNLETVNAADCDIPVSIDSEEM